MKAIYLKNANAMTKILVFFTLIIACENIYGQESMNIGLEELKMGGVAFNREPKFDDGICLDRRMGDGFFYLKDVVFKNGTIEADVKGSDTPQQSFVGIAFHGQDEEQYDVVYFRPFNFNNPERKAHSIQYVSHPNYTWDRLRTESPGRYEAPLTSSLDPNDWFHVRIEVQFPEVNVFVNDEEKASLTIEQLSKSATGWIGFWVGNGSDGCFRNLRITKSPESN